MKRQLELAPRRMSALDAGFLYLERPHARLHVGAMAIVEGSLSYERLGYRVESRFERLGNLGSRAMSVPLDLAHPGFELDPRFDARNHLFRWALPSPGREAELLEATTLVLGLPLDRMRPLWEIHVFEGLDEGRSAAIFKVHHALVDGVAGGGLLEALMVGSTSV